MVRFSPFAHLYGPIDQSQWAITLRPTQCGCSSIIIFIAPADFWGPGSSYLSPSTQCIYCFFPPLCCLFAAEQELAASILFFPNVSHRSFFYRQVVNSTQRQQKLAGKMRKMVSAAPRNYASKWKTHFLLSFAAHLPRTWKLLSTGKAEKSQLPEDLLRCSEKRVEHLAKGASNLWRGKVSP